MRKVWILAVTLMIGVVVTGCGGDSSNSSNSTELIGGAIQGKSLSLANTVSTIAGSAAMDGTGADAHFSNPNGIIKYGADVLFVADANYRTIRKVVISTGVVTTIAGAAGVSGSDDGTGSAARFSYPAGITTDNTNLFVTDRVNNNIRMVVISTGVVTTIAGTAGVSGSADGAGAAASFNTPKGITTDGDNLYVSDSGNHTIRKIVISTGAVTTIAGTAGESGSVDGAGAAARFNDPYGMVTDGADLFVADAANNTIRRIVISSGVVTTIAGTAGVSGSADGTGAAATFYRPYGIATDGANLLVTDAYNHTIRNVVISSGVVTTIAGTAGVSGSADGTGAAAQFNYPYSITTTDGVTLFVSDSYNFAVRKVVLPTGVVTTIAGGNSVDGTGSSARLSGPAGITTDGANLYVAENDGSVIRKVVISTGVVTTIAGTVGAFGSTDGTGAAARFLWPNGITTDGANLYVTDAENYTIRKIVISTGAVTTIAGTAGVSGSDDGTGSAARFDWPAGITTEGANLFVVDEDGHTIRKIVISTGVVTTIAGAAGVSGSDDGAGAAARFDHPYNITTDGSSLFVTDLGNHTIRKIVISTGVVTTIAGTAGVSGSADGTGAAASFNLPQGITTDGANLFVVDGNDHTIRKIVISTGVVTTIAGTAGVSGSADGTGAAARFNGLDGVTTDGTSLFAADNFNNTIRKIQ